ncbi:hypothetical protein SESBI_47880 [Sesbania bispinosa]|nr:hypothetical protein SESBI_47880 [Sesbania bispinosa]
MDDILEWMNGKDIPMMDRDTPFWQEGSEEQSFIYASPSLVDQDGIDGLLKGEGGSCVVLVDADWDDNQNEGDKDIGYEEDHQNEGNDNTEHGEENRNEGHMNILNMKKKTNMKEMKILNIRKKTNMKEMKILNMRKKTRMKEMKIMNMRKLS